MVHHPVILDSVDVNGERERSVVFVERNLDKNGESQVVTEGKARNFDVVLEAGPNIERFGDWIHFNVTCDECALDSHESRLEHTSQLDLRAWANGSGDRHRQRSGLYVRLLGTRRVASHPLATVVS